MKSDIEVKSVSSSVEILGMVVKPVRGVTEDGTTIFENNFQLEVRNSGRKPLSFLDCTVSYRSANGDFLGADSDGTLNIIKPGQNCILSIPIFMPDGVAKKELEITSEVEPSKVSQYGPWLFVAVSIIFLLIIEFLEW